MVMSLPLVASRSMPSDKFSWWHSTGEAGRWAIQFDRPSVHQHQTTKGLSARTNSHLASDTPRSRHRRCYIVDQGDPWKQIACTDDVRSCSGDWSRLDLVRTIIWPSEDACIATAATSWSRQQTLARLSEPMHRLPLHYTQQFRWSLFRRCVIGS
jgi:hypothetical protein